MNTRTALLGTAAAVLVAGGTVGGVAAAATGTSAAGATQAMVAHHAPTCSSGQVDVHLLKNGGEAGMHDGVVQFTAKPRQSCMLPAHVSLDLVGAHDVLIDFEQEGVDTPPQPVNANASAYIPLQWSAHASPAHQQTPLAIVVDNPRRPGSTDGRITLPWTLGTVDATAAAHTIAYGQSTAN